MESIFTTNNPNQTKKLGKLLAKEVLKTRLGKRAFVFGLRGDLGGGKTTFLQGFAKGLGVKEKITSPTFVIMRKFEIRNPKSETNSKFKIQKFQTFYHFDCYRIENHKEILDLGFKEILSDPQNIVAIEWADKIKKIMPKETIWLKFEFISAKTRKIMLK